MNILLIVQLAKLKKYSIKQWSDTNGTILIVYEYELFYYYEFLGMETISVGGKIYTHNLNLQIRRTKVSPVTSFNSFASQSAIMDTNTFEIGVSQGSQLIHSLNSAGIIPKVF